MRFSAAKVVGAALTWGLQALMGRDGATMPGKYALRVDPDLLAHLASRLSEGSVLVVGTNGKTSVTNLLADVMQASGKTVACNRTGANLSWGVASTLLQTKQADWGVFETDELWIARVLPQLKSRYVVLLNLFPDQLDRFGDIGRIQESLVSTLKASPETVLLYNADDPLCAAIAAAAPNRGIAFGVDGLMDAWQEDQFEGQACQQCGARLRYEYRQYSQLGSYACEACSFARSALDYAACDVRMGADGLRFTLRLAGTGQDACWSLSNAEATPYLAYNLAAVGAAAHLLGLSRETLQQSIDAFNPQNGRLQRFDVKGHSVLLNLAKNPTGFNQNIGIILRDEGPRVVAFFVNNKEGDGRDPSWIEDVNFESLVASAKAAGTPLRVFAGGMCADELQKRLDRAGLEVQAAQSGADVFAALAAEGGQGAAANVYVIANYTALPPLREELVSLAAQSA